MRGKNIPKELWSLGENFSINISTSCTVLAMMIINIKYAIISEPVLTSMKWYRNQFIGAVMVITKITAAPIPKAVINCRDIATNGHIPKR
jgi:hypothetical protein